MGMKELTSVKASFWQIQVPNYEGAKRTLAEINAGKKKPEQFPDFKQFKNKELLKANGLESHMRGLSKPLRSIAQTADDEWYVFEFFDKKETYTTFEDQRNNVINRVEQGWNEVNLLKELQSYASVQVDTAAFNALMRYYDDIHISEKAIR
jgi:hypothetical protein